MDYKELSKCLRMCCSTDGNLECDCDHCLFRDKIIDGGSWADYTECVSAMGLAAADAIDELLKAAKKMHTWIFLHTGDEQKAYDECGLSDEMNAALGYGGQFVATLPKEET